MGPQSALAVLGLEPAQDMDKFQADLSQLVREVDQGQGVLVLADLFGGSPANTAAYVMGPSVEVVCGASLPMLIEVFTFRAESDLAGLVQTALQAGAAAPLRMADMLAN